MFRAKMALDKCVLCMLQLTLEVIPTERRIHCASSAYGWGIKQMVIAKQGWLAAPMPRQRWKTDGHKWGERLHIMLDAVLVLVMAAVIIYAPFYTPSSGREIFFDVAVMLGCAWILAMRTPHLLHALFGR